MAIELEFSSTDETKQAISTHFAGSELENDIAHFLRSAEEGVGDAVRKKLVLERIKRCAADIGLRMRWPLGCAI